jgi:hypothetical protein
VIICFVFVKMEWTNEKTAELIEVYKAKTVQWGTKNPKYYNKVAENDAWTELADPGSRC